MRLDGRTIPQMAAAFGVSPRSVDRMLEMIRRIWASSGLIDEIDRSREGTSGGQPIYAAPAHLP